MSVWKKITFHKLKILFKIRGNSSLSWQNTLHPNSEQGQPLLELQGGANFFRTILPCFLYPGAVVAVVTEN